MNQEITVSAERKVWLGGGMYSNLLLLRNTCSFKVGACRPVICTLNFPPEVEALFGLRRFSCQKLCYGTEADSAHSTT
jgi:hypothetical protein